MPYLWNNIGGRKEYTMWYFLLNMSGVVFFNIYISFSFKILKENTYLIYLFANLCYQVKNTETYNNLLIKDKILT